MDVPRGCQYQEESAIYHRTNTGQGRLEKRYRWSETIFVNCFKSHYQKINSKSILFVVKISKILKVIKFVKVKFEMTPLGDFYHDWIQCENYDILAKFKVCKSLSSIGALSKSLGIGLFIDQWLVHILVLLFIAAISVMLFASLTEEQMVRHLVFYIYFHLKQMSFDSA